MAPQTVYQPSANDPRIVAVLDARTRLDEAFRARDAETVELLCAPDLILHTPINAVVDLDTIMARLREGRVDYTALETKIDFAGVRGDMVVVMGEEILTPPAGVPNASRTVHRRFTDIWKESGRAWKVLVRQTTIASAK